MNHFETPTLFGEKIDYFKSKRSNLEMAYQLIPPANGRHETVILIHGLGDAMGKMHPLAKKFIADGYGVLLVDLRGHGRTLKRTLELMEQEKTNKFPETFKHKDNVLDIRDLILEKRLGDIIIVGHSHGGGVGYALAHQFYELRKSGRLDWAGAPNVLSVHLMAPYVSRIDKFLTDMAGNPELWIQETSKSLVGAGADANMVDSVLDPIFQFFYNSNRSTQYFIDYFKNGWGGQKLIDTFLDPAVEISLRKSFSDYFKSRLEKIVKRQLNQNEMQLVDLQVEVSIKVVKGNRDFDLLDRTHDLPPVGVDVQVLGARADKLVPMAQLMEFDLRLKDAGISHELSFVKDRKAGHDLNTENTDEVYSRISERLKRFEKELEHQP